MKKFICISFIALFFAACLETNGASYDLNSSSSVTTSGSSSEETQSSSSGQMFQGHLFTRAPDSLEPGAFEEICVGLPQACCEDCYCVAATAPLCGANAAPLLRFYSNMPISKVELNQENPSCEYNQEGVLSCYSQFHFWENLGQFGVTIPLIPLTEVHCNYPVFVELNEEEYRRRYPDKIYTGALPEPLKLTDFSMDCFNGRE
ncbi:MAG: hypothetical protein LBR60_05820 [Fibrobacter sp.]|jgi:hypothetical protein|nr:hypothetical protein [Fibrobacter sp.]